MCIALSSPGVAFLMFIAANYSWAFVYCVIILCVFLLPHVYCFTVCVCLCVCVCVALSSPCDAFLMCIAANCSWAFVYCVITLCVFLLPHVYCSNNVYIAVLHNLVDGLITYLLTYLLHGAESFLSS